MAKVGDKHFIEDEFRIIEEGFQPSYGEVSESVFSLANEYMGIRGNFEEGYSGPGLRGSYFNGIYEEYRQQESGYRGISNITEYMVNSVDYFCCRLEWDGELLDLEHSRFRDFRRVLDLRSGILTRTLVWQAGGKELEVSFERFLCMDKIRLGGQKIRLKALDFSGSIKVSMILDFTPVHRSARENKWECREQEVNGTYLSISGTTRSTGQKVTAQARVFGNMAEPSGWKNEKQVGITGTVKLKQGEAACVGRIVRNLVDRNNSVKETVSDDQRYIESASGEDDYKELSEANIRWWERVWEKSDIRIEGDIANQQGIRFCIFQMFQTCHGSLPGMNIGAKGLTGEAYNGNAFWDTEIYYLPFYVFQDHQAARNLLLFRYLSLDSAMERARELDCEGAFYPVATISGKECCNLWQHASLQLQASTAVAYGIWFYEKQSNDWDFVVKYGARMLVEISRMLATRGDFSADKSRYGYYGVMGPDEFQMMVNNNYYTNSLGKFTLEYTLTVLNRMQTDEPEGWAELMAKAHITQEERSRFALIADRMYLPYDPARGLFEQHEGYFNLPHVDIHQIPMEEFPLYHHWTYDRIYRNDMIKQPDVLMAMFLFPSSYNDEQLRKNYEYYEARCIHESSLSPSVHSVLAAQLGKYEAAYQFFAFATRMDLDNYNRNTREGLHTPSIAAAWINIVYGFGGMRSDGELLSFAPSIPEQWDGYSFRITCREDVLVVKVNREKVRFSTCNGTAMRIIVYGRIYQMESAGIVVEVEGKGDILRAKAGM